MRIRVRFNRNVLGGRAGTVGWVEATPLAEKLVENGSLRWLDAPVLGIPEEGDPADDGLDDELVLLDFDWLESDSESPGDWFLDG